MVTKTTFDKDFKLILYFNGNFDKVDIFNRLHKNIVIIFFRQMMIYIDVVISTENVDDPHSYLDLFMQKKGLITIILTILVRMT